ncbi:MAG: hypothetical protein EBY07_15635 [Actinobacteria bacterium]|nr:hypothetical protein [Actinomycetota bacterium]
MGKAQREKGKRGERATANEIAAKFGIDAHRGQQSRDGSDAPDVVGLTGWWIEVKTGKRLQPKAALEQADAAKDKAKIESRRDIYGRLGHASFSVRLTNAERRDVVRFARSLNIPEQRSFSRLLRYAVKLYLCACDDAKRQAQSPEPASEDSPLPSAS